MNVYTYYVDVLVNELYKKLILSKELAIQSGTLSSAMLAMLHLVSLVIYKTNMKLL